MIVGLEPVIIRFKITYTAYCNMWKGMCKKSFDWNHGFCTTYNSEKNLYSQAVSLETVTQVTCHTVLLHIHFLTCSIHFRLERIPTKIYHSAEEIRGYRHHS